MAPIGATFPNPHYIEEHATTGTDHTTSDPWPRLPDPEPLGHPGAEAPLLARLWRQPVGGDDDPLVVAQRRR